MLGGRRYGVEIKYSDAPTVTKSMHVARADLALERIFVVTPGVERYELAESIEVCPLPDLLTTLQRLQTTRVATRRP